jgi:hypothetical protein
MAQQMAANAVNFDSDCGVDNQNGTWFIPNDDSMLQGQLQDQRSSKNSDPSATCIHYLANNALSSPLQSIVH